MLLHPPQHQPSYGAVCWHGYALVPAGVEQPKLEKPRLSARVHVCRVGYVSARMKAVATMSACALGRTPS